MEKEVFLKSSDHVEGIHDDEFIMVKDELQQVRRAPQMYISSIGNAGELHLVKEIVNNAIDECNNDNDHWKNTKKEIVVEFYESENKIVISDNGRGIPADILASAVMHKHTSTKMIGISEIRNKKQAGMNGVGMTVTAALTDYMSVTSYRGYNYKMIEVIDGELKDSPMVSSKKYQTGTRVELLPSEKYLGPLDVTTDMMEEYIRNISYVLDSDITITFIGEKDPKAKNKKLFTHVYKAQGLSAAVKFLSSSLEFAPIEVKSVNEKFDITLSFSYDKTLDDMSCISFCNYIVTTEGGCHEVAATRAICEFFTKEAKKAEPNSKHEVSFDDCKKGLVFAVNFEHVSPKFEGQHKTKVSNNEDIAEAKRGLYSAIYKVMNNNPSILKRIINYLRTIARAREEAHKIKGVSVKKKTTFLEDSAIDKYWTVSNRNSNTYKELFLCEGDSAASGILSCRNATYQAVYTVQGVTDNVHDLSLGQLLQKKTFSELITILGTGIGKDFDITKLRYNKIIICCDSDTDGSNITSLLLCFFFIFMPELIKEGKVYKAMPPLYLMDLKSLRRFYNGREWLYDKGEYYNMLNTIIVNNCEIALDNGNTSSTDRRPSVTPMSDKEAYKWLRMNSEYKLELDNLGKKSACDPKIIETVCHLKLTCKSQDEFMKKLAKIYPEMDYDPRTSSLIGSLNGEFFSLICDSLFDKSAERFMAEMRNNQALYVWYRTKKDPDSKFTKCTIGEFLTEVGQIFNVKINQRFKGLGEAEAELLFRTTTNPKFRKLLKIDIVDLQNTKEVFELLHGKSVSLREARRELIDNTKLSYADIDN